LLRDQIGGTDAQLTAIAAIIDRAAPDILLLTSIDHDAELRALTAFNDSLTRPYPHLFALPTNAGLATGLDMDGNGRTGEPRDAQGYGRFYGHGGMALLSRYPVDVGSVQDYTALLWRDLPGAELPMMDGAPFPSPEAQAIQRLSSTGHWVVPVTTPADSATPPVFDGSEGRNRLRNRDELRLWSAVLDGALGPAPTDRFVILGNTNLDPVDGAGYPEAIAAFLADPRLQDPRPTSEGGQEAANPGHQGDPALDTAQWPEEGPGNLRVSYVLPSADWRVIDTGVFWPGADDPDRALIGGDGLLAGPHRLVWLDIAQ